MMKNPHPAQGRFYVLIAALGLMLLLFLAALYDAQILNGSENRARSIASNATWQTVEASRGILTDTNGAWPIPLPSARRIFRVTRS